MEQAVNAVSDVNAADTAGAVEAAVALAVAVGAADAAGVVDAIEAADSVTAVSGTYVAVKVMAAVAAGEGAGDSARTQRNRTSPPSQAQNGAGTSSCNRRIRQSQNIRGG